MLNLVQHLTKSRIYETLKQVQGDKQGLFTIPSCLDLEQKFLKSGTHNISRFRRLYRNYHCEGVERPKQSHKVVKKEEIATPACRNFILVVPL
jgi:hypothetical protein